MTENFDRGQVGFAVVEREQAGDIGGAGRAAVAELGRTEQIEEQAYERGYVLPG